jgi:hypothetical protein
MYNRVSAKIAKNEKDETECLGNHIKIP